MEMSSGAQPMQITGGSLIRAVNRCLHPSQPLTQLCPSAASSTSGGRLVPTSIFKIREVIFPSSSPEPVMCPFKLPSWGSKFLLSLPYCNYRIATASV